jgi:hypothetical protein
VVCVNLQVNSVCILMLNEEFKYETSYFNVFIRTFSFSYLFHVPFMMFLCVCVCV